MALEAQFRHNAEKLKGQPPLLFCTLEMDSDTIVSFGKYTGKSYSFVRQTDVAYCNWILKQMNVGNKMLHFKQWLRMGGRKVTCECCNGSGVVDAL